MNENRKNRGNGLIWAIILVVIVAITVTFIVIARSSKYEPGKTENGLYLNSWADVEIKVPAGLKIYREIKADNAFAEIYMRSSGTNALMFGFAAYKDSDIDTGMEEMKQVFIQAARVSKNANISVTDIRYPVIAGKEYKYLPIKISGNGATFYIGIYGRKVNRHGSFLIMAGTTESMSALEDLVKQNVSTYK